MSSRFQVCASASRNRLGSWSCWLHSSWSVSRGTRNTDGVLTALARDLPAGYSWPGNVRELEQAVRRVLLTGRYLPAPAQARNDDDVLVARLRGGELSAAELVAGYSRMLYRRLGTYADVAKRPGWTRAPRASTSRVREAVRQSACAARRSATRNDRQQRGNECKRCCRSKAG